MIHSLDTPIQLHYTVQQNSNFCLFTDRPPVDDSKGIMESKYDVIHRFALARLVFVKHPFEKAKTAKNIGT